MSGLYNLKGVDDLAGMLPYVAPLYVDTFNGKLGNTGASWEEAFLTMSAALAAVQTGGTIYFVGDVREELTGSNLKFDVKIIGAGGLHHPDQPATSYNYGASMWRAPASPTTATNLLVVRGRGWEFHNIAFDCPVDAAAVQLSRNALATTAEYDASHAVFKNCRFLSGKYGVDDAGGANNVTIEDCEFAGMTTAAIFGSSTAVANPRAWKIRRNVFPSNVSSLGNATHIDASLNESQIKYNDFGTVLSTAKYIDLTGGAGNTVSFNTLGGVYDTDDYVAGTGDLWYQNAVAVVAVTAPDGVSLAAPAAP